MSSLPDRNMFEIFSQGLFEGVKPMMVIRDHLIRHPDRCTHQAICVPICPTGAWLSTPPYKFDSSRCLESCRLCLDACPSQAIFAVFKKGEKLLEPLRRSGGAEAFGNSLADSVSFRFPSPPDHLCFFTPSAKSPRNSFRQTCGRTTKEILSPGRASVLSATERKCCGLAMILMPGR